MAKAGFAAEVYARTDATPPTSPDLVGGVKDASTNDQLDLLDTTAFGNAGYKSKIVGLSDLSIDMSGDYLASDAGQAVIRAAKAGRSVVYVTIYADPSASAGSKGFRYALVVTEFSIKATVSGLIEFSAKFAGTGTAPTAV